MELSNKNFSIYEGIGLDEEQITYAKLVDQLLDIYSKTDPLDRYRVKLYMHPDTGAMLKTRAIQSYYSPFYGSTLLGHPIEFDSNMPKNKIVSISQSKSIIAYGINPDEPTAEKTCPAPTLKALLKHWLHRAQGR